MTNQGRESSGDQSERNGESTLGSGTQPEGKTRQDPDHKRPGELTLSQDPMIGRTLLRRYRVIRRLGAGGMGTVYAGEQLAIGREVALKVLKSELLTHDEVRQRFRREAEIIGHLSHPNIVQLLDYGETDDGMAVMVMELLRGQSLSERLADGHTLELAEVLRLGEEVSRALAEAHKKGLVHRDLKPANIFLVDHDGSWYAKVLDFGIARLGDEQATRLTSSGQIFGTPRYMSPEQAVSTAEVDARADIYSLGLILYEAMVGEAPFYAETSLQYLSAHATQTPPKLRDKCASAPHYLDALIDSCLQKSPDQRPADATVVTEALASIRLGSFNTTNLLALRAPELPDSPGTQSIGRRLIATLFMFVLGGLGAFFAYEYTRQPVPILYEPVDARVAAGEKENSAISSEDSGDSQVLVPPLERGESDLSKGQLAMVSPSSPSKTSEVHPPQVKSPLPSEDKPKPKARRRRSRKPVDSSSDPQRPVRKMPPRTQRRQGMLNEAGGLAPISEGRDFELELSPDGTDLVSLGKECHFSEWRGLSKVTTRGCPDGCALIIDEQCGGKTPAAERRVAPGTRDVAVVCGEDIVQKKTVTFVKRQTLVFECS